MNYILTCFCYQPGQALIGCQSTPLKGMHNSSAGEAKKAFHHGPGKQEEKAEGRRERGEGEGAGARREGEQVGSGEEERDPAQLQPLSPSASASGPPPPGSLCKPQALLPLAVHCTGQTSVTLD